MLQIGSAYVLWLLAMSAGIVRFLMSIVSEERCTRVVDEYLLKNALDHAKGINDTTKGQLKDALREGIGQGEGIPELRNRVRDVFSEASTNRANTIARTETAQAFEAANQQAMKESGVVSSQSWLTAQDSRVRISHQA